MNNPELSRPVFIPLGRMDYPQRHGLSCADCSSACCRKDTVLALSKKEAWTLIEAGAGLFSYPEDEEHQLNRRQRRNEVAFYRLEEDCPNLLLPEDGGPGQCTAFRSPERPAICREFTVGDFACKQARLGLGIDTIAQPGVA